MSDASSIEPEHFRQSNLKFCRHPYYPGRYAAIDADQVLVQAEDGAWGRFNRNARWIEGPLRHADPIFCRWVTGEIIARENLASRDAK